MTSYTNIKEIPMSKNIDTFDENEFDDDLFQKANGLRKEEEIEENEH